MTKKIKVCSGTGIAKGFGCKTPLMFTEYNGRRTYDATYGLCNSCKIDWAMNDEEGKKWLSKQTAYKIKKNKKEKEKEERKELREKRIQLNTGNAMKNADTYFSRYIRLKYSEEGKCTCYTCGDLKEIKEIDNGHFEKRGYKATRYHEDNCRPQCKTCNGDTASNGKQKEFRKLLVMEIGEEKVLEVERLAKTTIKADTNFYLQKSDYYREKVKEIQKEKNIKIW